jgi:hypothetical protein
MQQSGTVHAMKREKTLPSSYGRDGLDPIVGQIRATRGQAAAIARELGIERTAVYQWKRVPSHWVQQVARILRLPPSTVRPDIFARPTPRRKTHGKTRQRD